MFLYLNTTILIVLVIGINATDQQTYPCELWETIDIDNSSEIYTDGSIKWNDILFRSDQIFFVENEPTAKGCICSVKICLPKCCPLGASRTSQGCTPGTQELHPDLITFYGNNTVDKLEEITDINRDDYIVKKFPIRDKCGNKKITYFGHKDDKFFVLENGTVLITTNGKQRYEVEHYCLEWEEEDNKVVVYTCFKDKPEKDDSKQTDQITKNIMIGMCISIPFLFITFVVYSITPELQNIFGKCLRSQIASLTASYVTLLVNHIRPIFIYKTFGKYGTCALMGYISQYAMLSNFFWLSVMCFDIWLVFSGFSISYRSLSKEEEIRRFIKYSCFAWGTPFLICVFIYVVDINIINEYSTEDRELFCMMKWEYGLTLFYTCPLLFTLVGNVVMFSATASNIYKHKKQSRKVLKSEDNCCNNPVEKERLRLYFKLFLIMGICWVCEPISLLFNNEPAWFWATFDQINAMHGFTVFAIFVCNNRTLRTINKAFFPSIKMFTSERNTTVTSPTNSSNSSSSFHKQEKTSYKPTESIEMATTNQKY